MRTWGKACRRARPGEEERERRAVRDTSDVALVKRSTTGGFRRSGRSAGECCGGGLWSYPLSLG